MTKNALYTIILTNDIGETRTFKAGWQHGLFSYMIEAEPDTFSPGTYTEKVQIGDAYILNGDAWRDMDTNESLDMFIRLVIEEGSCAETFLEDLHEVLENNGEPGQVLEVL